MTQQVTQRSKVAALEKGNAELQANSAGLESGNSTLRAQQLPAHDWQAILERLQALETTTTATRQEQLAPLLKRKRTLSGCGS